MWQVRVQAAQQPPHHVGRESVTVAFSNYLPVAFFSLIQATLLMVVLQFGLQLQIDNVPAFYAMGYLTALVFAAIMQMLMAAFGFPGKFVAIILLMLQLTACAGTFPIQTTPDFFQVINVHAHDVRGAGHAPDHDGIGLRHRGLRLLRAVRNRCRVLRADVSCSVSQAHGAYGDLHPVLQLG